MIENAKILMLVAALASDGEITDPGFEDGEEGALSGAWTVEDAGFDPVEETGAVSVDDLMAIQGRSSLLMELDGQPVSVSQTLSMDDLGGQRLTLRGAIRTNSVEGQVALFASVEGGGRRLFFDDMSERAVAGSTPWTYHNIVIPPIAGAEKLTIGVRGLGAGRAWFDALSLRSSEPGTETSEAARAYLEEVLDIMEAQSLRRAEVDWTALRSSVTKAARGAETPVDVHPAIRYALTLLDDPRSGLMAASMDSWRTQDVSIGSVRQPVGRLIERRFGYVVLEGFQGELDSPDAQRAAGLVKHKFAEMADRLACGWILDLRAVEDGDMWPVLAGLGVLYDQTEVGACAAPDGEREVWWVRDDEAGTGGDARVAATLGTQMPFDTSKQRSIAVLTSARTAGAGEAIALSLAGQSNVRRFGETTAGQATSAGAISLSDGSTLMLTRCTMEDRDGRTYPGGIPADEPMDAGPALQAAVEWLRSQEICQGDLIP